MPRAFISQYHSSGPVAEKYPGIGSREIQWDRVIRAVMVILGFTAANPKITLPHYYLA